MAASSPGRGVLFSGLIGATPTNTKPFSCGQLQQASFFIRSDGTASISYTLQAANMPDQSAEQGPPYRDDSASSNDWATIQTGTVGTGASGAAGVITVNYTPYRALRLILTSTATPRIDIYAFGTGAAS